MKRRKSKMNNLKGRRDSFMSNRKRKRYLRTILAMKSMEPGL
jgi:hypothetical protein